MYVYINIMTCIHTCVKQGHVSYPQMCGAEELNAASCLILTQEIDPSDQQVRNVLKLILGIYIHTYTYVPVLPVRFQPIRRQNLLCEFCSWTWVTECVKGQRLSSLHKSTLSLHESPDLWPLCVEGVGWIVGERHVWKQSPCYRGDGPTRAETAPVCLLGVGGGVRGQSTVERQRHKFMFSLRSDLIKTSVMSQKFFFYYSELKKRIRTV